MPKKIDLEEAFRQIGKCKRQVEVRELAFIMDNFIKGAREDSEIFIRAKKILGEAQFNVVMNTLIFAVCSQCMEITMPTKDYQKFTKSIMVEEEVCDPSKAN